MTKIPKILQSHINTAFPANVCLVGSVLPNGFAQVSPRGSTMVFDDTHIGLWERGKGSTTGNLGDGTPLTVFFRKPQLREEGILPRWDRPVLRTCSDLQIRSDLRGGMAASGAARKGS